MILGFYWDSDFDFGIIHGSWVRGFDELGGEDEHSRKRNI